MFDSMVSATDVVEVRALISSGTAADGCCFKLSDSEKQSVYNKTIKIQAFYLKLFDYKVWEDVG